MCVVAAWLMSVSVKPARLLILPLSPLATHAPRPLLHPTSLASPPGRTLSLLHSLLLPLALPVHPVLFAPSPLPSHPPPPSPSPDVRAQ